MLDERGAEAFLLLDFHSVKNTSVAVKSDEKLVLLRQILQLCNIIHLLSPSLITSKQQRNKDQYLYNFVSLR
jgi:hypothetical protein